MGSPLETSPHFRMRERFDPDGTLRLALSGELDLPVAQALADRLQRLRHQDMSSELISPGSSSSTAAVCES